jgi:tight adherence protein B
MSPEQIQTIVLYLTGAAVFGLVLSVWLGIAWVWYIFRSAKRAKMEERLGLSYAARDRKSGGQRVLRLWREGESVTTVVPGKPNRLRRLQQIRNELKWNVSIGSLILIVLGSAGLLGMFMYFVSGNVPIALAIMALSVIVPWVWVNKKVNTQRDLFEAQFADALSLATRSLRAGHPLLSSFKLIVDEMEPPVSTIFGEICQQQSLGVGLPDALRIAGERSSQPDMKLFTASIIIQLRSGGNIADMMERLSAVIRDRIRLHRRARVLTAEAQLSKRVLLAVPFVLFVIMSILNPNYVDPLLDTTMGKGMLLLAGILMILGTYIINRLAILKY